MESAMKELTDSSYRVYLTPDSQGAALARVEWLLSIRDTSFRSYIDHGHTQSREPEPLRFSTDAARLRELAKAMLACARELDAIEAYTKPSEPCEHTPTCFGYLETITLADAQPC
jgi:hypothetical protein